MKKIKKFTAGILSGMLMFMPNLSFPAQADGITGDVNGDSRITILDVIKINKAVAGKELLTEEQNQAADVDGNHIVDSTDSLHVLKYVVGLIDSFAECKALLTAEDIRELAWKGDDLTWADFEQYQSEEISSGQYMLKFKIADNDDFYLLVCGETLEGKPDSILLCSSADDESIDLRSEEVQNMVRNPLWWWNDPEDDEENRAVAKQIGEYALTELQNGTYTLETRIKLSDAPELMNEEISEVYQNSVFYYLSFVDEHTVLLRMDKGLLDAYGYLITDGSVTYSEWEYVPVPDEGYDGDHVYIEWAGENLYYFSAGT